MANSFNPKKEITRHGVASMNPPDSKILRVQTDYQRVPSQFLQNRFLNGKYNSDLTPTEPPTEPERDPRNSVRLGEQVEVEDQEIEDAFWLP